MSKIDQMSPQEKADLEKLSPDVRALVEKFGWEAFEGQDARPGSTRYPRRNPAGVALPHVTDALQTDQTNRTDQTDQDWLKANMEQLDYADSMTVTDKMKANSAKVKKLIQARIKRGQTR